MGPDAAGLRAALPAILHERWDHIAAIDARIGAALAGEDLAELEGLARDRTDAIASFADDFPLEWHSAELRIAAMRHLLSVNEALMSLTRQALAATADTSATARHQRRAISAYHENQPES
jgi:hypothetical protein